MQKKSIYDYFFFGTSYEYLRRVSEGFGVHDPPGQEGYVIYNLDKFFTSLDELGLRVTAQAAWAVLQPVYEQLKAKPADSKLTDAEAQSLKSAVQALRLTLESELVGLDAFVVTPKRLNVEALQENPAQLFATDVFPRLPEIAQFDFREAGRCIAFERPTAAAFHILRGTEAVLKAFYFHHVRTNRASLMWGPMVTSLRSKKKLAQSTTLFNNLDNIRVSFRNPTQHPEKTYDPRLFT